MWDILVGHCDTYGKGNGSITAFECRSLSSVDTLSTAESVTALLHQANADVRATSSHKRFAVMDGLRGVAALAVVLFHSYKGGGYVVNGALAVDFFFILSGFVVAYSYEDRLRTTMTSKTFIISRLIRLYPMLLIGALGGLAIALIHNVMHPADAHDSQTMLISGGLSLLVLPYLGSSIISDSAFDFNPPIWSLFFELAANIVYALIWRRLSMPMLIVIVLLGLAGIAWFGPLGGGGKVMFYAGTARVAAGFFGGVLLQKLWRQPRGPRIRGNMPLLSLLLVVILCLPFSVEGVLFVPFFVVLCAMVLAAADAGPSRMDRLSEFLGETSYPIYLTHWLTLYLATFVGNALSLTGPRYIVVVLLHFTAIPFIGFAVGHLYETPVRLWLSARFLPRRMPRPASAGSAATPGQA